MVVLEVVLGVPEVVLVVRVDKILHKYSALVSNSPQYRLEKGFLYEKSKFS